VFEAYRRYAFHEVVRLVGDFVITMSAEYLDPVKDALYCEAPKSRARRSVQTVFLYTVRAVATWIAPFLCFTAQDVADELGRVTGEPFDVHGQVRDEVSLPGRSMKPTNQRWTEKIRPQREAILKPLEAFRAAGHKSLEARVVIRPSADDLPDWTFNRELLLELCVVSEVVIGDISATDQTEITVEASTLAECPRCWRRLPASGKAPHPELCARCAEAVAASAGAPAAQG